MHGVMHASVTAWCMGSAERKKLNVLEMKCLRSLVGVSRINRLGNEEVRRRTRIKGVSE